jgi:hypothetical protein
VNGLIAARQRESVFSIVRSRRTYSRGCPPSSRTKKGTPSAFPRGMRPTADELSAPGVRFSRQPKPETRLAAGPSFAEENESGPGSEEALRAH